MNFISDERFYKPIILIITIGILIYGFSGDFREEYSVKISDDVYEEGALQVLNYNDLQLSLYKNSISLLNFEDSLLYEVMISRGIYHNPFTPSHVMIKPGNTVKFNVESEFDGSYCKPHCEGSSCFLTQLNKTKVEFILGWKNYTGFNLRSLVYHMPEGLDCQRFYGFGRLNRTGCSVETENAFIIVQGRLKLSNSCLVDSDDDLDRTDASLHCWGFNEFTTLSPIVSTIEVNLEVKLSDLNSIIYSLPDPSGPDINLVASSGATADSDQSGTMVVLEQNGIRLMQGVYEEDKMAFLNFSCGNNNEVWRGESIHMSSTTIENNSSMVYENIRVRKINILEIPVTQKVVLIGVLIISILSQVIEMKKVFIKNDKCSEGNGIGDQYELFEQSTDKS